MKKNAVILFNLGGPDRPESVRPFLFNLFNDKAIIGLPQPMRFLLARLISGKREKEAQEIYEHLGGKSPILEQTQAQGAALEKVLNAGEYEDSLSKSALSASGANQPGAKVGKPERGSYKIFITMRYWHPRAEDVAKAVKDYAPDSIILLPLYPQFSTTTTGSSFLDWQRAAKKSGLDVPTRRIESYPTQEDFIAAHVALIRKAYAEAEKFGTPRILFSAHGLPEKIIRAGDPYQQQVEATTRAVLDTLGKPVDYTNCYQSKVGPLEWIKPATEDEIKRAGHDGVPVVIVPIAFVSEHSETLVELDIQYKQLAKKSGVPGYVRVPALQTEDAFIRGLARLCLQAQTGEHG